MGFLSTSFTLQNLSRRSLVASCASNCPSITTWYLARHAGLKRGQAVAIAAVYLLYPLVFNLNLFDFHPEVIVLPALLGAILAARLGKTVWFCLAIAIVLICKAALALTVAAMGIWLLYEKKRLSGAFALLIGVALQENQRCAS